MSAKALIVLLLAKEQPETTLRINSVCNFLTMKSAVELNILLLNFVLLCLVNIQESCREDNAKFNLLGII